jgi:hypothetical protein
MIYSAIKILGGILLVIGSITNGKRNPQWSRIALFLAGAMAFTSGVLTVVRMSYGLDLSQRAYYLIKYFATVSGSVCLGVLLTLFLSGELSLRKWKSTHK